RGSLSWRVALPLAGAAAASVALSVLSLNSERGQGQHGSPTTFEPHAQAILTPPTESKIAPTVANYHRVASRSLAKLDQLLAGQAKRIASSAPVYTAAMAAKATLPE